jgi:PBP1b-binding outer membrane lipoprotein LpoB
MKVDLMVRSKLTFAAIAIASALLFSGCSNSPTTSNVSQLTAQQIKGSAPPPSVMAQMQTATAAMNAKQAAQPLPPAGNAGAPATQ